VTTSLDYTETAMAEVNNDYLGGSPGFSIRESTDLDHYRAQPGRWTVDVTQLAKGSFGTVAPNGLGGCLLGYGEGQYVGVAHAVLATYTVQLWRGDLGNGGPCDDAL